jgi:hypothetical protein
LDPYWEWHGRNSARFRRESNDVHFKEIGKRNGPFDIAFVESGYVLDFPAQPDSLRVWVNETEVLGSWSYDEVEQKGGFLSDAPTGGGETVRIAYNEAVACGGVDAPTAW